MKYSWNEMYALLNLEKNVRDFFSTLSEFVHGLSTSNLCVEKEIETFEPVYGIATSLLGKLHNMLNDVYSNDMVAIKPKLMTALCDKRMPKHF